MNSSIAAAAWFARSSSSLGVIRHSGAEAVRSYSALSMTTRAFASLNHSRYRQLAMCSGGFSFRRLISSACSTGTSSNFWGRAIGWYAMALADVLDFFPTNHPARPEIIATFQKLCGGVVKYQDPKRSEE